MTTLAVLAGGEGRRMGGPKDLLLVGGKPVLVSLLERIHWIGGTVLVAPHGGRLPPGHEAFDRVVSDAVAGQGPLRGILAAINAGSDEVVVIPVDMPGVEREHLEWLSKQAKGRVSALGVMLKRGNRVESFPSLFRAAAGEMIQRRLDAGLFAVHQLSEEQGMQVLTPPHDWSEAVWRNVNEPGELPEEWSRRV